MTRLLFKLKRRLPGDPLTFVAVSFLLIVIALTAGGLPALRATKLDPLKALRD